VNLTMGNSSPGYPIGLTIPHYMVTLKTLHSYKWMIFTFSLKLMGFINIFTVTSHLYI